jgi:DNA (cytosine-5)-methyltransferase 1
MKKLNPPHKEPVNSVGTVAELFAGVGGFRIGLARAGWMTVYSNQWEPSTKTQHASDVYAARFGHDGHSNEDISTVKSIPKVDLLVGGFPCQDYSVAKSLNSSRGLEGKKGVLWWEILRLIEAKKPRFIFLENVDRLLKSPANQRGRDFAVMLRTLSGAGYLVEWRIASAADYGFPQRRIRVFIVARKLKEIDKKNFNAYGYITEFGVLAQALPVTSGELLATEFKLGLDAVEISANFNSGGGKSPFLNSGVFINNTVYTLKTEANFKGKRWTLGDVLQDPKEVPADYWIDPKKLSDWEYLKGSKSITRVHKESGVEYQYAEGKMAYPDLLENPSRTILTGEGGSSPSRFKHIVKIGSKFRRLTPIELERLNGFPDDWTRYSGELTEVSDARRAFFMGNALVIGMVERVGKVLAELVSE